MSIGHAPATRVAFWFGGVVERREPKAWAMELRNLSMHDLWLYEAIHCDPGMMEHLGGPLPREGLPEKLERDVATTEAGETLVPDGHGPRRGSRGRRGDRGHLGPRVGGPDHHGDRVDGAPGVPGPGPGQRGRARGVAQGPFGREVGS